jgi:hypothetical protein
MLIVFVALMIYFPLTFDDSRLGGDPRGTQAFMIFGVKSEGFLFWFSWSIFALGFVSWFVSGTLLVLWKRGISFLHNLLK